MRLAAVCLLLTGCVAGAPVRVANVAAAGTTTATVNYTVAAWAPATVGRNRGNGATFSRSTAITIYGNLAVIISRGIGAGCEAGAIISILQLGIEGRCVVPHSRDADPVSIAVSAAALWRPIAHGFAGRFGFDLSGGASTLVLGGLYATLGRESTAVGASEMDSCPQCHYGTPTAMAERIELRLHGLLGVARQVDMGAKYGGGAATMHLRLWSGPLRRTECDRCGRYPVARGDGEPEPIMPDPQQIDSLDSNWGLTLQAAFGTR